MILIHTEIEMNDRLPPLAPAPEVVFTMGLPGAGKSYVLNQLGLLDTHECLDSDSIMATHPEYDPKRPELLYHWAAARLEDVWQASVATGKGLWIVDGTGSNAERMVRKIREAHAQGFRTRLVYVQVTLKTALARNATRTRTVPVEIILGKEKDIATAYDIIRHEVTEVTTIDNN